MPILNIVEISSIIDIGFDYSPYNKTLIFKLRSEEKGE